MNAVSPVMMLEWPRRKAFASMGIGDGGSWAVTPKSPCDAATLRQIGRLAFGYDVRAALGDLVPSVLALAGTEEVPSICDSVPLIARKTPHGRGVMAPGPHSWPVVAADLFAATVLAWLADAALPDALAEA